MADFAKAHLELRQHLSGAIKVPGENATDEEKASYRKALGIPDKPDGYGIKPPDGADDATKERLGRFAAKMHEIGAPKSVVEAALAFVHGEVQAIETLEGQQAEARLREAETELRKEWVTDADYTRNMDLARKAVVRFGGDDLAAELDASGLGNNPKLVKAFATIGGLFAEDAPSFEIASGQSLETLGTALEEEYAKRQREGTLNQGDFLDRWVQYQTRAATIEEAKGKTRVRQNARRAA